MAGMQHARRVEVDETTRALGTVGDADYAAAWEVVTTRGDRRSAEQWARASFEGAPPALRASIVAGWVAGLGLRLGPRPSPDHVLGWRIVSATPDLIVLRVPSVVVGTAHLVVRVEDSRVVLTSFVRHEKRKRLSRAVWSAVAPLHQRIVPFLLAHAASHPQAPTG